MGVHRHVYPTPEEAAVACGKCIFRLLEEALSGERPATLALSGGSSPRVMFDWMAAQRFDWERVHIFFVDERGVPPASDQSNYKLANDHLFAPAHIPHRNVHRVQAELAPDVAAAAYIDEIRDSFRLKPGEIPHFDVIHRGMGPDAHTASLFPGEPLIEDREGIAAAVWVEKMGQWRITLLPAVLLAAEHTVMLVAGADKAEAARAVFSDPFDPVKYPAQLVTHHGRGITWFLDQAAARLLD